jgi:hypothetical protein
MLNEHLFGRGAPGAPRAEQVGRSPAEWHRFSPLILKPVPQPLSMLTGGSA